MPPFTFLAESSQLLRPLSILAQLIEMVSCSSDEITYKLHLCNQEQIL